MRISAMIVAMKAGIIQQIGQHQDVYNRPDNLFVAKFLGTPPINVFSGEVKEGWLTLGEDRVLKLQGAPDGAVTVGVRPEGFRIDADGPFRCGLKAVEVMGRDTSVVGTHPACQSETFRGIIPSEDRDGAAGDTVRFSLKPNKIHLFDPATDAVLRDWSVQA